MHSGFKGFYRGFYGISDCLKALKVSNACGYNYKPILRKSHKHNSTLFQQTMVNFYSLLNHSIRSAYACRRYDFYLLLFELQSTQSSPSSTWWSSQIQSPLMVHNLSEGQSHSGNHIMIKHPWNEDPLTPHFYMSLVLRPDPTQNGLYSHRRWLEAWNFVFRK